MKKGGWPEPCLRNRFTSRLVKVKLCVAMSGKPAGVLITHGKPFSIDNLHVAW